MEQDYYSMVTFYEHREAQRVNVTVPPRKLVSIAVIFQPMLSTVIVTTQLGLYVSEGITFCG